MRKIICLISICILIVLSFSLVACDNRAKNKEREFTVSEKAQAIIEYLGNAKGNYVVSGQQESTWISENYEFDYIYEKTGKYPAIRGLDYINDDFTGVNERAIKWWNKGGIVTICWHTGKDFSGGYNDCKEDVVENWDKLFEEGSAENIAMIEGMDKAAQALKELQDQGVIVLWRPFHEFDGDWFWWSKGGAENFVKLWNTMWDRYNTYWHLDNLIWVLGYSHMGFDWEEEKKDAGDDVLDWFPGHDKCDIVGADSYVPTKHIKLNKIINKKVNKEANKPTCYHECGENPTLSELKNTSWSYFMTWHTEYLIDRNTDEALQTLYTSDYVITLDELPKFN